jgi:hypothetical protein
MALYQRHVITDAVRRAAESGARNPNADNASVWTDAKDFSNGILDDGDLVNIDVPCGIDQRVVLEVSHPYTLISPLQGLLDYTSGGSSPSVDIELGARSENPRSAPC